MKSESQIWWGWGLEPSQRWTYVKKAKWESQEITSQTAAEWL
jgi:hypothetical protein